MLFQVMIRHFVQFCLFYFLCNVSPSSANTEAPRVFNGRQTSHKFFPFVISILSFEPNFGRWNYHCGGSLVSRTAALTAAHCVVQYPSNQGAGCVPVYAGNMLIIAGTDYVWRGSPFKQQSYGKWIQVHPSCYFHQDSVIAYDTAVVTLASAISYNEQVQPLKLFSGDPVTNLREFDLLARTGAICYVVGYGHTGSSGILSEFIQFGDMTLMTNDQCRQIFCQYNRVFCNTDFQQTGWACASTLVSTPCRGDSGGPLVCNGFLFGTVSWGRGCFSDVSNPAVFGDMAAVTFMVNLYKEKPQERERANKPSESAAVRTHVPRYCSMILLLAPLLLQQEIHT